MTYVTPMATFLGLLEPSMVQSTIVFQIVWSGNHANANYTVVRSNPDNLRVSLKFQGRQPSRQNGAVEINIRDANAFYGFGGDQCRSYRCIVGVNTFRAILAACRSLWFLQKVEENPSLNLLNGRPWYRKKKYPTQFDVYWMFKEALICEGIIPTPTLFEGVPIIKTNHAAMPPAAA